MAKIKDLDGRVENVERTEKGKGKKRGGRRKTARNNRITRGDVQRRERTGCVAGRGKQKTELTEKTEMGKG